MAQNYQKKKEGKEEMTGQLNDKLSQMERREEALVSKLKMTQAKTK